MKKGFTLPEMIIAIASVLMIAVIVTAGISGCEADWQKAERSAAEYAKKVPEATGQVSCMKTDSDDDGYCRCTIFRKTKDPLHVECGCEKFCIICTDGCSGIKHTMRPSR